MNELISKITEDLENSEMKIMKVYHSTFSNNREFSKENTFTEYDVEKYGAFHGAIDIEGTDSGRKVAENRVFVKILEDAKQMVGISPVTLSKVLGERDEASTRQCSTIVGRPGSKRNGERKHRPGFSA